MRRHPAAVRLAEYMGSIVEAVTSRRRGETETLTAVQCRRLPKHRRCLGKILAALDARDRTTIIWMCPACDDHGSISGWQETLWDKRKLY